ncbi:pancreatic triacylglycerol lipase-like isoform 2-T2 [Anomaloglossus baeobatrachus]|uniref:pancreatic triacylglycerol lipase-like isoform X2 n=1 Tax=Anomaloglossus baeobatrachus TaxID=238106 RepID=UPI003F5034F6
MIGVSLAIVILVGAVKGGEVCYSRIGCFTDNVPWAGTVERPISQLPWSPDRINVRFLLFTKSNPTNFQEVNAVNPSTISASNFRTSRKTRFIIHGFVDKGEESWLMDMCKSNFGYSPGNVHVIGHSLGAHAAGEVGKRRRGIARITGLDPAEPYFQGTPIEVRLDPSDAAFVDAIHTDAAPMIPNIGFGMSQLLGHVDFFPNGGEEMPGCKKNALSQIVDIDGIWQGTRDFVACNHLRSYKYYSETILRPDAFVGFPTSTYSSFNSGSGFPCPSGGCPLMGHYADSYKGASGQKFFLRTGDSSSFARWRYKVTIQVVGTLNVQGFFHVSLFGPNGNTRQYEIFKGYINTGNAYTGYIDVESDVGPLNRVKFVWNNNVINPLFPTIGASSATVQYGKDGVSYRFCGSGTVREEVLQTLNPC